MPMFLEYFNLGAAFFIIVCMVLMLGRLLGGPTLYDRLLAVNSFGTKTIIFLCIFCFIINESNNIASNHGKTLFFNKIYNLFTFIMKRKNKII